MSLTFVACMYACMCVVWCDGGGEEGVQHLFSSGVQGVPGCSVGVLICTPFSSLLATRYSILLFGLFVFFLRAPYSVTVFFYSLGVPIANQLEKVFVPQPGVGAWDR